MTQAPVLLGAHVMVTAFLAAAAVGLAAWATARLLRARAQLRHLHDPALDEMTLRAEAEAVLAEQRARGEIDGDAYARALLQLEKVLSSPRAKA